MALVIELIGAPGSGKSTIARELVEKLQACGGTARLLDESQWTTLIEEQLQPLPRWRRVVSRLSASRLVHPLLHPGLYLWSFALALSIRHDEGLARKRLHRLLGWTRRAALISVVGENDAVIVADEGPYNWLMGTLLYGRHFCRRCFEQMARELASTPPRQLVFTHASNNELVLERMIGRTGLAPGAPMHLWRFPNADETQALQLLQEFQEHMQCVLTTVDSVADASAWHVFIEDPPEHSAEAIRARIQARTNKGNPHQCSG